ncbi:hypothetical protein GLOIN_2v1477112 [Rhizophagus irregularis DAOM 181602=DAOM 197198]|nr:hypothetical protein GLOIN_2v1477112 [Rhizophagus irregularis DAOM 181602=DAOM 197198]
MNGKEISNYPENSNIVWKNNKRTFYYKVIRAGIYPKDILCYIKKPTSYSIPHVKFGNNFSNQVVSSKSPSDATTLFHNQINQGVNTRTSGVLLFGLHLESIHQYRIKPHKKRILKPVNEASHSTLTKRAKSMTKQVLDDFTNISKNHYNPVDKPILEKVQFSVNNYKFKVNVNENLITKECKNEAMVMVVDNGQISRDAYRKLTTIEDELPREWTIAEKRTQINIRMNDRIKINTVIMPQHMDINSNESYDIFDPEVIEEVTTSVGKGGKRSIKDVLKFIVPNLIKRGVLNLHEPIISIRISGDGRNVGKKVKHVMITFAILEDIENIHNPNYHYTVVLYPGLENYESLDILTISFREELQELKEIGININGVNWTINMYFSSDWKFLTICLGFNSANSLFFCPWCTITKKEISDIKKKWLISKQIDNINQYNGHHSTSLFNMISLENWIPDELHIMLRITDRLWSLLLHEIEETGYFNDVAREIIVKEMNRIKVNFHFWQEKECQSWILPPTRANVIRNLWNGFFDLYTAIRDPNTDPKIFKRDAKMWLKIFLTPSTGIPNSDNFVQGLYRPNDVTPYMHVLVFHIHEFIEKHKKWGLKSFSCAPVENKNHQQVTQFFRKTLRDGGNGINRKSAILQILEFENRKLYYICNDSHNIPNTIKLQI